MVAATLVGQAGVVASEWPLSVDVQSSQLHFVVEQSFRIVPIGQVNTDNLLILRIQVVEAPEGEWDENEKNERMANLSMMAMAVGRLIRSLAVSIVLRLLPSLLIDSIWGGRSIKEAANDSFIELPEPFKVWGN